MKLYDFAAFVRRAIVLAALAIAALIILKILYGIVVDIYLAINPPPEAPPTVGFGKLPELRLASLEINGSPAYLLETPTGALPSFDDRAYVVAMKPVQTTLLGEEKARELADELDFGGEGDLSANKKFLTFRDALDKRTLIVNVTTQNFSLTTDPAQISKLTKGSAPSGTEAVKAAQQLLDRLGLQKFGFEAGNQTTSFKFATTKELKNAGSISEAHLTEVSFFRSLTEVTDQNFPILPLDPKKGLIQVQITTGLRPEINNILGIVYNAQEVEIDKEKKETYPLRDVAEAWEEVKAGQGVAFVGTAEELKTIQITSISLAYFDDVVHQEYLQPIFVFSGVAKTKENQEVTFTAYRPAVSKEWVRD